MLGKKAGAQLLLVWGGICGLLGGIYAYCAMPGRGTIGGMLPNCDGSGIDGGD